MQAISEGFPIADMDFRDGGDDDGGVEYVTLREASSDKGRGTVPNRYDALRKAAEDSGFPEPAIDDEVKSRRRWSTRVLVEWSENRNGEPGVYVVRPPGSATAKIGHTTNLKGRIRRWNVTRSSVLLWVPCASKQDAQLLEDEKHAEFAEYHVELEWFWYRGRLVEWVEREMARQREAVKT